MKELKQLRKLYGVTQQDVGSAIGVGRATIANYENGNRVPSGAVMELIADYFGVSVDFLMGRNSADLPKRRNRIPVIGYSAAGTPTEAIENALKFIDFDPVHADIDDYFGLYVLGDSMEPELYNNDIVVIKKQTAIDGNSIYLIKVNGEDVTLKRIKKMDDGLWLMPKNPSYEPVFYSSSQVSTLPVAIIGKVIEMRRNMS